MLKTLLAPTEDFIKLDRTVLDADITAGSSVALTVLNNSSFAQNDYIVIGYEGSESAELCQISSAVTPGTTLVITTAVRSHKKGEPIVKYRYNKRKFYGSTTETGTYTELTAYGSPVTIQVSDPQGTYLEYTGSEGYEYFKATYFNSQDSRETDKADSDSVQGDQSTRYCSIFAIRVQAGLTNNPYITDGQVETYRKRAENEVNSYIISRYQLPLVNANGVSEVPWMIENITTLLAAGYMDYQEFGQEGMGVKWLGEARGLLKKVQSGEQALIGIDGQQMAEMETLSGVQSYPDTVDNTNGPVQVFTMGQRF